MSDAAETNDEPHFAEVGGLQQEIQALQELIEEQASLRDYLAKLGLRPSRGILLTGPPGVGKTLTARAVARAKGDRFIYANCSTFLSDKPGMGEKQITALFNRAADISPATIFLDEIDTIASNRDLASEDFAVRLTNTLLWLMDGMARFDGVTLLAATNRPRSLDPALRRPGRFDSEFTFYVPSPTQLADIFVTASRKFPKEFLRNVHWQELAKKFNGFTGADVDAGLRVFALDAARSSRAIESCTEDDLARACSKISPSIKKYAGHNIVFPQTSNDRLYKAQAASAVAYVVGRTMPIHAFIQAVSDQIEIPIVWWTAVDGADHGARALTEEGLRLFREFAVWLDYPSVLRSSGLRSLQDVATKVAPDRVPLAIASARTYEVGDDWSGCQVHEVPG